MSESGPFRRSSRRNILVAIGAIADNAADIEPTLMTQLRHQTFSKSAIG